MMKFLRKHNKRILAVLCAVVLVVWLAGDALQAFLVPDVGKTVLAKAVTGDITRHERERAESSAKLQELLGLSWRRFIDPNAPPDEQLGVLDWILLTREARKMGIVVSLEESRETITSGLVSEDQINQIAVRADVTPESLYAAAADFIAVTKLVELFRSSMAVAEPELRQAVRDAGERASIEAVVLPAESFADPEESIADADLQAQFEPYKDRKPGPGRLDFGYYVEPEARVQYFRIDPAAIKDQLRRTDSYYRAAAYEFWKQNKDKDPRFLKPAPTTAPDVDTNGNPTSKPAPEYFATFEEAAGPAMDAVRMQDAKAEADRIAAALQRLVAEPWFSIQAKPTEYRPAPESVRRLEYYAEQIEHLPANLRYAGAVEVVLADKLQNFDELSELPGIGETYMSLPNGGGVPFAQLATTVEGLLPLPEESRADRSLYLSQWQTAATNMVDREGRIYLFRVVEVREGHVPAGIEEVRARVSEDVRLLRGMAQARQAARQLAEQARSLGLQAAWDADETLRNRIGADKGGYSEPAPFARDNTYLNPMLRFQIPPWLQQAGKEFMDKAFALAAAGAESTIEVVELPAGAQIAVIKGKQLQPVTEEAYQRQRTQAQRRVMEQRGRDLLRDWFNARHIRERNGFKFIQDY